MLIKRVVRMCRRLHFIYSIQWFLIAHCKWEREEQTPANAYSPLNVNFLDLNKQCVFSFYWFQSKYKLLYPHFDIHTSCLVLLLGLTFIYWFIWRLSSTFRVTSMGIIVNCCYIFSQIQNCVNRRNKFF